MQPHILIVDTMHPSLLQLLSTNQWTYDYLPLLQREEILARIGSYQGLILRSKVTIDRDFLMHARELKFIARAGAGLDQIDIKEVQKQHIALLHAPEGNRQAVAEHTIGMLLALFNQLHKADREVKNKIWDREGNRGIELQNKTVGIIGYGTMGKAVAKCLTGFGCKVLGYDKYHPIFATPDAISVELDTIFDETDILSLHIPLTHETANLLNSSYFSKFRKPIYVINTARGEIVNLTDLAEALETGKVQGACLDVLENEKLQTLTPIQDEVFQKLAQSGKVIFSPHVAGWTHESYIKINEVLVDKIKKLDFITKSHE